MQKKFFTLLLSAFCVLGYSQINSSSYPDFIGQYLDAVENNKEWEIIQKASGDLNRDGLEDLSLILESTDSIPEKRCSNCKLSKNKPRIILVLLNQINGEKVIIQNNNFIARGDEGGMLNYIEPELSIENGVLTVLYQYLRSNQSYTFELKNGRMEITGAKSYGVHAATGNFENDQYDFKTGEIISETGNISQEKVATEILKINVKPKSLSEFGLMYDWKITENKYL